tara:strand:+ start:2171 stop:3151 length:981 start_codon:yes stop_codon:yes gene_type:complete
MEFDLREENLSNYKDKFGLHYYSILAHLSSYFDDSVIAELGTLYGKSAAALAYNKSNTIYTYDIKHQPEAASLFEGEEFRKIKYIISNCIEDNWVGTQRSDQLAKSDKEIFLSSEIIFMDIDPAEGNIKGAQEDKVLNFLISNNWKGILVCDDIGAEWVDEYRSAEYTTLPIREWWDSINLPKFNVINNYSSPTGTGIICFDNQKVVYTPLSKDEETHIRNKFYQDPANWPHSPTRVPIDRFTDGTFEVDAGHLKGLSGHWESTTIERVTDNFGIYDNGTTTHQVELDEDGVRIIPKKIIIIKTWAGELTLVEEWGEVRRVRISRH